jgi:hypothetical protein
MESSKIEQWVSASRAFEKAKNQLKELMELPAETAKIVNSNWSDLHPGGMAYSTGFPTLNASREFAAYNWPTGDQIYNALKSTLLAYQHLYDAWKLLSLQDKQTIKAIEPPRP